MIEGTKELRDNYRDEYDLRPLDVHILRNHSCNEIYLETLGVKIICQMYVFESHI